MLLSTFELLLKDITPNEGNIANSNRKILQGYFLTISNPNDSDIQLRLKFTATTPSLNSSQLIVIEDTGGSNNFGSLDADNGYNFDLEANDTGLIILQPDIINLDPSVDAVEFRGYVEIHVRQPFPFPALLNRQLLFTPEHRGTFLPNSGETEFDQLFTAVPTSTGASLMEVDSIFDGGFPPFPPFPLPNAPGTNPALPEGADMASMQQALVAMTQSVNELRQQVNSNN
ncbi:hypothetical protein [Acaryochloris sp. IP29b_bin.148]|uniref:hypothetical protein n=1 Tax=Acaryochloris sp. IP29b_bin.148 TaxID=2969218 RepID=UPI002607AEBC|nr:hypothetical protein [Acaryochloris sp. IP29b_bin.148]